MRILLTGGTGFIGTRLCEKLLAQGHDLTVFSRRPAFVPALCGESVTPLAALEDLTPDSQFDAVINLAGESIAGKRWTEKRKQELLDSRLLTTRNLVEAMARMKQRPRCLISGSAVGYYGDQGDREVDENTQPNPDFGHHLCDLWEKEAHQAEALGVRVCIVRTSPVIGRDGGFLKQMLPPFRLGLGGPMGSGDQWFPWIHREDEIRAMIWLIEHDDLKGPFNAAAPGAVTNRQFAKTLGECLGRPAVLTMPAFAARALFGEMADLFLGGQKARPVRLRESGFEFEYPEVKGALEQVLASEQD